MQLIDAGVIAANRLTAWRIDVADTTAEIPAVMMVRWTDRHATAGSWTWTGTTLAAAQRWATARGLPAPDPGAPAAARDRPR